MFLTSEPHGMAIDEERPLQAGALSIATVEIIDAMLVQGVQLIRPKDRFRPEDTH